MSISRHSAPTTSPVRAAVRMAKRSASAAAPSRAASARMKAGTCRQGRAAWCSARPLASRTRRFTLAAAGRVASRLPRQLAGLKPRGRRPVAAA
jgi:hypothetical protein